MKKKISISLLFLFVIFTLSVKIIDVKAVGVNNTEIGFATLNVFIHSFLGVNKSWYNITEFLGVVPIIIVLFFAGIGVYQLIKRKSILKIDRDILMLGVFYIVVAISYLIFEVVVINYRPILVDGVLEASYPSSHTILAICIIGTAIIQVNKRIYNDKIKKYVDFILAMIMILIVVGRLLSGVHWFTDIVGGTILSISFVIFYSYTIDCLKNKMNLS